MTTVRFSAHPDLARSLRGRPDALAPDGPLALAEDAVPWVEDATGPAVGSGLPASATPVFAGTIPLIAGPRELVCWSIPEAETGEERFRLGAAGVGIFSLGLGTDGGSWVRQTAAVGPVAGLPEAKAATSPAGVEVALGPVAILALALQGVYCLHASAVATPGGGALLFAGDSGRGKSTLASYLDGLAGWRRLTDDVTPVLAPRGAAGAEVWSRFPQLKLPSAAPPLPSRRAPITGVCLLLAAEGTPPGLEAAPGAEASAAVLRHTVASRLFDRGLLAEHLGLATALVRAGVYRLAYPHRRSALPRVAELLRSRIP